MNDTYHVEITITLDVATRSIRAWRLISTASPFPTLNKELRHRGGLPRPRPPELPKGTR
ncbi:hypothetical protein [Streptomyces sp. NPDC048196]|uniref:hypothetical protein n=1 Tax=Streptomyces sp. NPDC048196 TaxID=3154712 RepID=UPI0033C4E366